MSRDEEIIYPWITYKGAELWRTAPILRDVEEHYRRVKEIKSREDDILLVTCMKSGTHWLHEIISMLINHTTEYNSKGNFLDLHLELQEVDTIEAFPGPQRILHCHLPKSWLPVQHFEKRRKTVYLNRNPKDVYASRFNFLKGKLGVPRWTWTEFYDTMIKNGFHKNWDEKSPIIRQIYGWMVQFYKRDISLYIFMTEAVHNKDINIIQVLYEDLIMDPVTQVTRLAKYLEVPYTDDFIREVIEKCKFTNLKDHKIDVTRRYQEGGKSTLFRKGIIGDWKNHFTVAQNEEFDAIYEKEMKGVDVQFTYEPPK